jgi:hypothetical protein
MEKENKPKGLFFFHLFISLFPKILSKVKLLHGKLENLLAGFTLN